MVKNILYADKQICRQIDYCRVVFHMKGRHSYLVVVQAAVFKFGRFEALQNFA